MQIDKLIKLHSARTSNKLDRRHPDSIGSRHKQIASATRLQQVIQFLIGWTKNLCLFQAMAGRRLERNRAGG